MLILVYVARNCERVLLSDLLAVVTLFMVGGKMGTKLYQ